MPKRPAKHRGPWTSTDLKQLKQLVTQHTPTRITATRLGRTARAVQAKANEQGISLRPAR